jgi:hypothetical protein
MLLRSVSALKGNWLQLTLRYQIVLHPYYKLTYIEMAWGGAEEQEAEREAGNPDAKNWQDEALKIIEQTMEVYWKARPALRRVATKSHDKPTHANVNHPAESEYDRLRKKMIANALENGGDVGWESELRRYLKDMAEDVTKETDPVQWWSVSVR